MFKENGNGKGKDVTHAIAQEATIQEGGSKPGERFRQVPLLCHTKSASGDHSAPCLSGRVFFDKDGNPVKDSALIVVEPTLTVVEPTLVPVEPTLTAIVTVKSDEELVPDERANLTPSQMVDLKLMKMLGHKYVPFSVIGKRFRGD